MDKLLIPRPKSAGIILSYKCTSICKHCMYASSPYWSSDWISLEQLEHTIYMLSETIVSSSFDPKNVGVNVGLHFTGGEPFLNYNLLVNAVKIARKYDIPSVFVETNCFWSTDDNIVRDRLIELKNFGLDGVLVSVNPFLLEYIPFERTERTINIGYEIFRQNLMVYQEYYRMLFKKLNIKATLSFEEFLKKAGPTWVHYIELLPMGRAVYKLDMLFRKYPAKYFFGQSCYHELTRDWHIHIDNYGNYVPGYCGGISLGNLKDFETLFNGLFLNELPIIKALAKDIKILYEMGVKDFGYKENVEGYISKCHLCLDIRKHMVEKGCKFNELKPIEFYRNLS
ncbi:MAG: radical SAM protein [Nitrososphaeria archaeon]|nr:radical SAM protein [Nitrososphaeria archaeon]